MTTSCLTNASVYHHTPTSNNHAKNGPIDEEQGLLLKQPLLPTSHHDADAAAAAAAATCSCCSSSLGDVDIMTRYKLAFFLAGSVVAVASQLVLSQLLWSAQVLELSTTRVVLFSMQWSFWTVTAVFSALVGLVRFLPVVVSPDEQLHLEVHHVMGSLTAVSMVWLLHDVWEMGNNVNVEPTTTTTTSTNNIATPSSAVVHIPYMVMAVALCGVVYLLFLIWIVVRGRQQQSQQPPDGTVHNKTAAPHHHDGSSASTSLAHTLQMVAALLGLVVGACSQFILACLFWDKSLHHPIVGNVLFLSLLWSCCTVFVTATICWSLQCLTHSTSSDNTDDEQTTQHQQRLQLRMEAMYVNCTLIGICLAWIVMDLILNMREQILPSLGLLGLSLIVFRIILILFPEEDCIVGIGMPLPHNANIVGGEDENDDACCDDEKDACCDDE